MTELSINSLQTLSIGVLVICQNGLAVCLAKIFELPASLGMCTVSYP